MPIDINRNEIVVIGELNVDLIAGGLRSAPMLGHELVANDFEIVLGSASAIFACGIARLGRRVTFVGRVGDDEFGRFCVDELAKRGISSDKIIASNQTRTGVTIVLSTPVDRALVTYLGAIAELSIEDVPDETLDGHRHMHLTSYYLQRSLRPDFPRLMADARRKGLTTSFDPNTDPDQQRDDQIGEVLEHTDILFLNEQEAKLTTDQNSVESACRSLGESCPLVVVKLGRLGSIAYRGGEFATAEGFPVEAMDTTGAGDSFAAGFIHGYLDDRSLGECLIMGNACGALSTTKAGGTAGQPDQARLDELIVRFGEASDN